MIDNMKSRLDGCCPSNPKMNSRQTRRIVREKSAGKAFYQQPAPDGSRPGIYYANYDMEACQRIKWKHNYEGIQVYMQIAIAQELEGA